MIEKTTIGISIHFMVLVFVILAIVLEYFGYMNGWAILIGVLISTTRLNIVRIKK